VKRPDLVLYVNGIALGVLELKKATVSVSEGIRQNLDNQESIFIQPFFATMQLVMAGNDSQGIRYGTIATPEKYFLTWHEDVEHENLLTRHILQLCDKRRLLELVHDFVVFDAGVKKLPRSHQYFGVKAAQDFIRRREGGIIWHTQGSGKSLTMVWLTKWILGFNPNARVLIVTDRTELDKQIESVFLGVNEEIYRTKNGQDLATQLNAMTPWLLCSLVHKFGSKSTADDEFIEQLKRSLAGSVTVKGDLYVFVDECHRTHSQSGKFHKAMKQLLPNAVFIGFTGTPLLKKDALDSRAVFGKYIHTYKFNQAVADGVVLDLRYEARKVEQNLTSKENIDKWFDANTKGLNEETKKRIKQRWGTLQKVFSSKDRLGKIVNDIILDMACKPRFVSGNGNAMLVAGSIYEACKFYDLFTQAGFHKCAIVTSYTPTLNSIKGETLGDKAQTENTYKYRIYQKMLDGKTPEAFEDEVKRKFIKEPAQMKLLIVVDKLLTGFDAPPASTLYIDNSMQDHGLFQAICRVNRLDGEDKEFGTIVDYKDLFKSLELAVGSYTQEAFGEYEPKDVEGLLKNRLKQAREQLDNALVAVKALCEAVDTPRTADNYRRYFCGNNLTDNNQVQANQPKRFNLYKFTGSLVRAYAELANDMIKVGYSAKEATQIKADVKHYEATSADIKITSGDAPDLKLHDPEMRYLIDSYIRAEDSKVIANFDDLTLVDLLVKEGVAAVNYLPKSIRKDQGAVAETIENNIRRLIIDENQTNPVHFKNMSALLDELIIAWQKKQLSYDAYLKVLVDLAIQAKQGNGTNPSRPASLVTHAQKALYDNLEHNEALALKLDKAITDGKMDGWRGHTGKANSVKRIVKNHVAEEKVDYIFELVKKQHDY
jgi:type I restriction enzyme R subunit